MVWEDGGRKPASYPMPLHFATPILIQKAAEWIPGCCFAAPGTTQFVRGFSMNSDPKYLKVAKTLAARVAAADYPVGGMLPTENELVAEFDVSKQTIRQAVGLLQDWGIVYRRQGSGTVVRARDVQDSYVQHFGSLAELLQYTPGTRLEILETEQITVDARLAEVIGCAPRQSWWRVRLIRHQPNGPGLKSYIEFFFRDSHKGLIDLLGSSPSSLVHSLLEEGFGERVNEVVQEVGACTLSGSVAETLGVGDGAPGLRAIRRYYGAHRRLILSAINYHPEGYRYTSWLARQAGDDPVPV